jgi:CRISPR/Cas system-associated protein endoribonuclease Cas2
MSSDYIANQMIVVAPLPLGEDSLKENGQIMLKMQSDRGASNWLNITADQFSLIEKVLLGELE